MRCWYRVLPLAAIPSGRSGAASAIRCCCASPCSKLARWQRAYSARIKKGQRHEQNHFGKQGVPRKVGRLCGERRRNGAGGFRDKLSRSSRAEFVPTSPKGPGWPGVGAQRPVPYGRDRGLALLAPSFGGYAFDRSLIRHDPALLGFAAAGDRVLGGGALGGQAGRRGAAVFPMPL